MPRLVLRSQNVSQLYSQPVRASPRESSLISLFSHLLCVPLLLFPQFPSNVVFSDSSLQQEDNSAQRWGGWGGGGGTKYVERSIKSRDGEMEFQGRRKLMAARKKRSNK